MFECKKKEKTRIRTIIQKEAQMVTITIRADKKLYGIHI